MTRAKGKAQKKIDSGYEACIDCGATCDKEGRTAGAAWLKAHVCPTPGDFQKWLNDPVAQKEYQDSLNMTFAEMAKKYGSRHCIIYEMFNISQFADGSVFDCVERTAYKAEHVLDSAFPYVMTALPNEVLGDLIRNAKAAVKSGWTTNLAPRV